MFRPDREDAANARTVASMEPGTVRGQIHARFAAFRPKLRTPRRTYFSGAFVLDGELALLLAVIDVAQLVVKLIRRRRREPGQENREQGREAAQPAAEPEHVDLGREERRVALQPAAPGSLCGGRCCCCCCCLSSGPVCFAASSARGVTRVVIVATHAPQPITHKRTPAELRC